MSEATTLSPLSGLIFGEHDKKGLALEKYRPFPVRGSAAQRDLGPEGTEPHGNEETRLSESPPAQKAA